MDGIIAIDKPVGMTSAQVVASVKRITRAAKVGHTGTLDPFATGVLVCCLNRATRLASFFLHGDKGYEGEMLLGIETDTQDPTGRVIRKAEEVSVSDAAIEEAFSRYRGTIQQEPPVYSALKHEGVPLYKLARAGKPVQKPARTVTIHELSIRGIDRPRVSFYTLGCRLNQAETAIMAESFRQLGYVIAEHGDPVEVAVINTCSVTERADQRCRQEIRKVRRRSPEATVCVVGCYAQSDPKTVAAILGVDLVVGTDRKYTLASLVDRQLPHGVDRQLPHGVDWRLPHGVIPRSEATRDMLFPSVDTDEDRKSVV